MLSPRPVPPQEEQTPEPLQEEQRTYSRPLTIISSLAPVPLQFEHLPEPWQDVH